MNTLRVICTAFLVAVAACQDSIPTLQTPAPGSDADPGDLGRADRVQYDAPNIDGSTPVVLEPGGQISIPLQSIVHDADTPFELLTISATPTTHIETEIRDQLLCLSAAEDWTGTERVQIEATDPTGLSGRGELPVIVQEPPPQDPAPPRSCATEITYDTFHGAAEVVAFASEANAWSADEMLLEGPDPSGVFRLSVELPAGEYGYKLVRDGEWVLDPENPYLAEVDGVTNSLLHVPVCVGPMLALDSVEADPADGSIRWTLSVLDSPSAPGIDVDSFAASVNRVPVDSSAVSASPIQVIINLSGLETGRYDLRATIANGDGEVSDTLYAPTWLEREPFSWHDAVLYFAFVDRFRNGDPSNDAPQGGVPTIGGWNGGDFAGVTAAIEDGYFDDLGVNAVWISSPNDNPDVSVVGDTGHDVTAYHAYFPAQPRDTEKHFGTLTELQALTNAAHRHGIRVLADFVANHVYEEHPFYTGRASDDDFNPKEICRAIDWSKPITCWFEPYLPDINYDHVANVRRTVDDAIWWIENADLDGFRLDAVKHMNNDVSYRLRAGTDRLFANASVPFYLVGETFTGGWSEESAALLEAYVSPGELHGQFNFPVYWEIVRTLARREPDFQTLHSLDAVIGSSEERFGSLHLMGVFLGNHDVPRFVSHANGDIADMWGNGSKEQGWSNPPAQPTTNGPYDRLLLAFTLMLTLPGVPTIYYGDEVGLAGAGDPDNRRMYPWGADLLTAQSQLLRRVQSLGQLRHHHSELRRGERHTLGFDGFSYAYLRALGDDVSVIAINNGPDPVLLTVSVSEWLENGTMLTEGIDSVDTVTVEDGQVALTLSPWGAGVFSTPRPED